MKNVTAAFAAKILLLFSLLSSLVFTASAQIKTGCMGVNMYPFSLTGGTLVQGTANTPGAIYRYTAIAGQLDVLVELISTRKPVLILLVIFYFSR